MKSISKSENSQLPTVLANSMFHWLNYMAGVCNTNLLAESSARFPMAECLERRLQAKVKLEELHPMFSPKRVDFYYRFDNGKEGYIELKYLRGDTSSTVEQQRFFNDIVRLGVLDSTDRENYFILFGDRRYYENNFLRIPTRLSSRNIPTSNAHRKNNDSIYTKWFPLEMGETKILQLKNHQPFQYEFSQKYKCTESIGYDFCIKLVAKQPAGNEKTSQIVLVWKVTRLKCLPYKSEVCPLSNNSNNR